MEKEIIKAIYADLKERDAEITTRLADALSANADVTYIEELSTKSVVISDILADFRNNKELRRVFSYMTYLKQTHAVISEDFMVLSKPEELHAGFSKLEAITTLMFAAKHILSDKMDELLTYSIH